jgi:deoxyribonuclease-4
MKYIGPHVSTSGGVQNAPLNAFALEATAFGMFTKNQRQWSAPSYDDSTIVTFKQNLKDKNYAPNRVLAHDSYLINLGNPTPEMHKKSYAAFVDELRRCDELGLTCLNIHPGSHLKLISEDACCALIAGSINKAHDETHRVTVVLETTAGQGSNVGYTFEQLARIIGDVSDKTRIGVCIDTCHIFAAGYDIRTKKTYEAAMQSFEKVIGFKYLCGAHINDAKVELGSKVDRHQSIGKGSLGLETFKLLMQDPRFDGLPLVLETIDESLWKSEITLLTSYDR